MSQRPSNIAVIVTGGARGLGRAMVLGLLRDGISVTSADLATSAAQARELQQLAEQEKLAARLLCVECDVTNWDDCQRSMSDTMERFGGVHGLVNNAGLGMQHIGNVMVGGRKRFYEIEPEVWRQSIDVNLNGAFLMAKAAAPHMIKNGWGRVVNVVTSLFLMMMDGFSPYGPSKAALESATVIWSKELADTGVTVNALLPGGPANTRMIPPTEITDRGSLIQPEAMVPPILWLMSSRSDGITARRIIAKEWDAGRLRDEAPDKVGNPAGW